MENKENIDTKPKNPEKKKRTYKGFFKKVYNSIVKIERYPEMAAEGLPKAFSYFAKLVAIFAIISCLGTIYNLNLMLKSGAEYLKNEFPNFVYQDGQLNIESENPIIYDNNEEFGKIIIDTNLEDEKKITEYTNEITQNENGLVILKEQIKVKTQSVMGIASYNYGELFGQMGITSFNKETVVNFINSSQIYSLYASVFVMIFIYTFVIYFLNLITYVIFVSIFGCIVNLMTKLRMRYVAIFNMSIYSITLSTILYMIYLGINIFTPFTIKYFEPMYISIATIYLIAAILILKSETIKRQMEIIKIQEVQKKVREDMQRRETEEKNENKKQGKDKEDENKEKNEQKEEKEKNKEEQKDKKEKQENGEAGTCNDSI